MLIALLAIPAVACVLLWLTRARAHAEIVHAAAILGMPAAAIAVTFQGRIDALSTFMVAIITLIAAIVGVYSIGYMRREFDDAAFARVRLFYALFHLFVFTMLLAVTTDNLGLMWIAIEGTTLSTVFLVNLHDNATGLEAAYKYLIISSIGIALAFLGTVLMYYAAAGPLGRIGETGLSWTALIAAASHLNPTIVKLAFVFVLIGYGTKAGLAPMHTWLPDAHSQAPAPISAMMSGVLLNVGLYALMRFKAVTDITAGPEFASAWLMRFGLLSLGLAAAFLISQRDYKRMLAYSSVEHTGIAALGLGFGGYWGVIGALLHMLNHALCKSMLFILSGNILLKYGTTDIRGVRGLLKIAPWTGLAFLFGVVALLGMPPFGLFISEFIIFRAGFAAHATAYAVIGISLLALVFAGMLGSLNQMLYGKSDELRYGDPIGWPMMPIAINLIMLVGLGVALPAPIRGFLGQILRILGVPA
jgi:hydrogenase-4 component F